MHGIFLNAPFFHKTIFWKYSIQYRVKCQGLCENPWTGEVVHGTINTSLFCNRKRSNGHLYHDRSVIMVQCFRIRACLKNAFCQRWVTVCGRLNYLTDNLPDDRMRAIVTWIRRKITQNGACRWQGWFFRHAKRMRFGAPEGGSAAWKKRGFGKWGSW